MAGGDNKRPLGEVGILRRVEQFNVLPPDRCYLYIDHKGSSYFGCLLCSDHVFCPQIIRILESNLNKTIAEIGSLDISRLL